MCEVQSHIISRVMGHHYTRGAVQVMQWLVMTGLVNPRPIWNGAEYRCVHVWSFDACTHCMVSGLCCHCSTGAGWQHGIAGVKCLDYAPDSSRICGFHLIALIGYVKYLPVTCLGFACCCDTARQWNQQLIHGCLSTMHAIYGIHLPPRIGNQVPSHQIQRMGVSK